MTDLQTQAANAQATAAIEKLSLEPRAPFIVAEPPRKAPDPHRVPLPMGGLALMYTRENLVYMYRCSHGELGRLLRAKLAPLPVRIDGQILWFVDEVLNTQATTERTLLRWRSRR